MSLISTRRRMGAVCPKCKHPGYKTYPNELPNNGKPNFVCTQCRHIWQYGNDGGIYLILKGDGNG